MVDWQKVAADLEKENGLLKMENDLLKGANLDLRAENKELRQTIMKIHNEYRSDVQDAERLQYLIDNFVRCDPDMSGNHTWMGIGRRIGEGRTPREAIDQANKPSLVEGE